MATGLRQPRSPASPHVAIFTCSKEFRGVERVLFNLAEGLAEQGLRVDLVLGGNLATTRVPTHLNVVRLHTDPRWLSRIHALAAPPSVDAAICRAFVFPNKPPVAIRALRPLVQYLQRERPTALLTAKTHANVVALWARRLAGVSTRVVISEHVHFSRALEAHRRKWRWRYVVPAVRRFYPWADACVGVAGDVADDLTTIARLPRERVTTIYNPVVTADMLEQARTPFCHDWFRSDAPPVILGVGRLDRAHKDFSTLLRAFAHVRAERHIRLMLLGEGPDRVELEKSIETLGVAADVAMPGFVANPYPYFVRAAVFVLSSAFEGLPTVLIEALACGCPVVSTDCPSGPAEILDGGRYGPLVPVGDDVALARAICDTLDHAPHRERLIERAQFFSADRAVEQYCRVLLER